MLADQASIAIVNARLHQAVTQQARFDVLTGLPNRLALEEKLEEEIAVSQRTGQSFSVIMMDLDGFKRINDSHGHDAGDDVLRRMAHFLQDNLRTTILLPGLGVMSLPCSCLPPIWKKSHVLAENLLLKT